MEKEFPSALNSCKTSHVCPSTSRNDKGIFKSVLFLYTNDVENLVIS